MHWTAQPKNLARQLAVQSAQTKAKTAIFLPAAKLLCVKAAIAEGLIDYSTHCVLVERETRIMNRLLPAALNMPWEHCPYPYDNNIETLDLSTLFPRRKVDYAFLDFCSSLDAAKSAWLSEQLLPRISANGSLAMTLARTFRSSHYMAGWLSKLRTTRYRPTMLAARQKLRHAMYGGSLDVTRCYRPGKLCADWFYRDKVCCVNNRFIPPVFRKASVSLLAIMLLSCLKNYDFKVHTCLEYKNTDSPSGSKMVLFRLTDLQRKSV